MNLQHNVATAAGISIKTISISGGAGDGRDQHIAQNNNNA
jgi:hypothetical protein